MRKFPLLDSKRAAAQIAAVLSSTAHISPIWKEHLTEAIVRNFVLRWSTLINEEQDDEQIIHKILEDLASINSEFHTAWLLLTNSQNISSCNAIRNILHEYRSIEATAKTNT